MTTTTPVKALDPEWLVAELAAEIGAASVVKADQDLSRYYKDWSGDHQGAGLVVIRPASTADVCKAVRLCAVAGVPIIPQGGNSGQGRR